MKHAPASIPVVFYLKWKKSFILVVGFRNSKMNTSLVLPHLLPLLQYQQMLTSAAEGQALRARCLMLTTQRGRHGPSSKCLFTSSQAKGLQMPAQCFLGP